MNSSRDGRGTNNEAARVPAASQHERWRAFAAQSVRRWSTFFERIRQALTKGARKHRTSVSWCNAMQEFVRQQNIAEFRKLLAKAADKYQRRTLLQLLAEEEKKAPPHLKMKARDSND